MGGEEVLSGLCPLSRHAVSPAPPETRMFTAAHLSSLPRGLLQVTPAPLSSTPEPWRRSGL